MRKQVNVVLAITVWAVFFGLGFLLANIYNAYTIRDTPQKPVVDIKEKREIITEDTQIIYEQKFLLCNHMVISPFKDREILEGKSLEQLKKSFTAVNGYDLKLENDTLIIYQEIDDFCPEDKKKCRLKDYQGFVAVYKGANADNDALEKVTSIRMNSLPPEIQKKIRQGEWEFSDINAINDALENLDEYL